MLRGLQASFSCDSKPSGPLNSITCRARYATSALREVRILKSQTPDCFLNLATEEWMFKEMAPTQQTLFLWRNGPTVVIGRNQNPWKECHLQQMEADGVVLVRRQSGGGAVYQDLGNFIFTFISPKKDYSKERNTGIIIRALKNAYNIDAHFSGRNDILVGNQKISGSAFKLTGDRAIHHGTIMIDVNLESLEKYLNVNKEKLKSKGVASVRSRVLNLKTLNPSVTYEGVCDAFVKEFCREYGVSSCPVELLDPAELQRNQFINDHYQFLKDWKWRFGETPEFEHNLETRFDWGIMDIYLNSNEGIITAAKVYSDTLFPQLVDEVQTALIGASYDVEGIRAAMQLAKSRLDGTGCEAYIDELSAWLERSI